MCVKYCSHTSVKKFCNLRVSADIWPWLYIRLQGDLDIYTVYRREFEAFSGEKIEGLLRDRKFKFPIAFYIANHWRL